MSTTEKSNEKVPRSSIKEGNVPDHLQVRKDICQTARKSERLSAADKTLTEEDRKRLEAIQKRESARDRHYARERKRQIVRYMLLLPLLQYVFSLTLYLLNSVDLFGRALKIALFIALPILFLVLCYRDMRKLRHAIGDRKALKRKKLFYLLIMILPPFALRLLLPYPLNQALVLLSESVSVIFFGNQLKLNLINMGVFYGAVTLIVLLELSITKLRHRMGF